jgi:hypothetical protein
VSYERGEQHKTVGSILSGRAFVLPGGLGLEADKRQVMFRWTHTTWSTRRTSEEQRNHLRMQRARHRKHLAWQKSR